MKYHESESSTLEFKRQLPNNQQVARTIVGFCNQFGGKLIIGIDDTGTIVGIDEIHIDKQIESLQQSIYRSCTPHIIPFVYTQRIQQKLILIIEVSAGMNKPYYVTSLGQNEGTFVRVGSHTVTATPLMQQELAWKNKGLSADEIPTYQASVNNIDTDKFKHFLKEHRGHFKTSEIESLMLHYKLLSEEHKQRYPTLAGILLFGKSVQQIYSEAFIICTHFQGNTGRDAIATVDCVGDLFSQLETAMNFLVTRLSKKFTITNIKRKQSLEIPEVALREVLINAIVHRDYHLAGPIKIAVYDDRVEIFSPGNFPGPLNINQLENGITYIRNHVICRIFREAGYIEKLGSGFLTLFQSYRQHQLPEPQVIEGTGYIKCILPRQNKTIRYDDQDDILRLFYSANDISTKEITAALGISRQTAARRLSELVKQGILEMIGKGPAVRYRKAI